MSKKYFFIVLFYSFLFYSCNNLNEKQYYQGGIENSYWLYAPVIELVNKNDESIDYAFTDTGFNKLELKVLINVLERKGYRYKVTLDSQVMISKISAPNIKALYSLRGEIKNLLKDSSQTWRWK